MWQRAILMEVDQDCFGSSQLLFPRCVRVLKAKNSWVFSGPNITGKYDYKIATRRIVPRTFEVEF